MLFWLLKRRLRVWGEKTGNECVYIISEDTAQIFTLEPRDPSARSSARAGERRDPLQQRALRALRCGSD